MAANAGTWCWDKEDGGWDEEDGAGIVATVL
jgi:hypothetical protein